MSPISTAARTELASTRRPRPLSRPTVPAAAVAALAVAAGLCLAGIPAAAEDKPAVISGDLSFAGVGSWRDDGEFQASDIQYGADTALALYLDAKRPSIRAHIATRTDILTGSAATAAAALAAAGDTGRLIALGPDNVYAVALSVERAYLRWSPGPVVATLGRQVVNWGGALVWSPADLFAETEITGLTPERSGTDAARLAVPVGALGGIEAVAEPAAAFSDGRYGGRVYGYALGTDFGLQAAWDGAERSTTVAVNLKTDLVAGIWAEAAMTIPEAGDAEYEATVGADWSLGPKLIVAAEYWYHGAGTASADEAAARAAAGELFPGIHYLYVNASVIPGELVSLGFSLVADVGNGIVSSTVSAVVDVAQDASLTTWARYASGVVTTLADSDSVTAGLILKLAF